MNKKLAAFAVCLLTCLPPVLGRAQTATDPLAELTRGMPRPVAAFIERIVYCEHWAGEEPYNAERRAEINAAIRELRCTALGRDENRILNTYGKDERVRRNIDKAKAGIL